MTSLFAKVKDLYFATKKSLGYLALISVATKPTPKNLPPVAILKYCQQILKWCCFTKGRLSLEFSLVDFSSTINPQSIQYKSSPQHSSSHMLMLLNSSAGFVSLIFLKALAFLGGLKIS